MKKALIAMSGGVDSSVAAFMMKNKGYECIGCTMKLYDDPDDSADGSKDSDSETFYHKPAKSCCSLSDVEDARSVAMRLGMKYYVFNFKDEFKEKVIDKFIGCYLCGKTPNPCIECNDHMKFDKLYERAKILGYDYVVTGHYARIEEYDGAFHLLEGPDPVKDQSYVLYRMSQKQLSCTLLPLGNMTKEETRAVAEENGFINAGKKDSQDICFVPDGDYAKVIETYLGYKPQEGDFIDMNGKILGRHKGIIHYTIGQRKGLGISAEKPLYVIRIDAGNNQVILGSNDDLFTDYLKATDVTWTQDTIPTVPFDAEVRVRYHGKKVPATVTPLPDGDFTVNFKEKVRAITPGQAAVIYKGSEVLGGGVIV